jgi:hypothetical protein
MNTRPVITFRTLAILVIVFACGLAGSLLTPRFRAGPPAEQLDASVAASPSADGPGNGKSGSHDGELPKGARPFEVVVPTQAVVRGGIVLPGGRVDVAWVERAKDDRSETIILHNIRVVAVECGCCPEEQRPHPAPVTLAVTPKQADRLTRALERGTIRLIVLQNFDVSEDGGLPDGQ